MAVRRRTKSDGIAKPAPGPSFPGVERGDEIVHTPMQWLVDGAFPAYTTSILMGRKGRGKSMICVALTSQLTSGVPFPGYSGPAFGRVLWACREAAFGGEIGPRLVKNGADRSHYYRIHPIRPDGKTRKLNVIDDFDELREMVNRLEIRLLILDPIEVIVPPAYNLNDPQSARDYMELLNEMCNDLRVTTIGLLHMNKRRTGELTSAGYFSEQLVNTCRSVLRCDSHPHKKRTYILSKVIGNTGGAFAGLVYHFEGDPKDHPTMVWDGRTDLDVEEIADGGGSLAEQDEYREAEVLLYLCLQAGPMATVDLQKEAAAAGIFWSAMKRAKSRFGITPRYKRVGNSRHWEWPPPQSWPDGIKEAAEGGGAEGVPLRPLRPLRAPKKPRKPSPSLRSTKKHGGAAHTPETQRGTTQEGSQTHEKADRLQEPPRDDPAPANPAPERMATD